jgi:hypothetical protein
MKCGIVFSAFLAVAAMAPGDEFDTWSEASPDNTLFGIERRIPDPSGFVVFICSAKSTLPSLVVIPGPVIVQHDFPERLISRIRWSPDSKFLLFTTASSGGHSPWHFKTFVFCAADKSFRNVESTAGGSVGAPEFHFEQPDVAVLRLQDPTGGAPKEIKLPLAKAVEKMQRLE